MKQPTLYIPHPTPALNAAGRILRGSGMLLTDTAQDAQYLLYPAPTRLEMLGECTLDHAVIGGGLDFLNESVERLDLLKDPYYLASNAAITAECALGLLLQSMRRGIAHSSILILGWGRIGKCLTHQLHHLNARVTVCARRDSDRAMLRALGYRYAAPEELPRLLRRFHCIINTAPAPILTPEDARLIRPDALKLELATGNWLPGGNVLQAHGLPGRYKPEASGALIAKTVIYHLGGSL